MKKQTLILVILTCFISLFSFAQPRQTILFNFDWQFKKGAINSENIWDKVQLPHDASISGSFSKENSTSANGWLPYSNGMYKKTFMLPVNSKNKMVYVQFDGVYRDAQIWVNGKYLGRQLNGYIGFQYNLTPFVYFDKENLIEVYYDNTTKGTSRWYTGEGIYRDVRLVLVNKLHIPQYGVFISTPEVSKQSAKIVIETEIENFYQENKLCSLITKIIDNNGEVVQKAKSEAWVKAGEKYIFNQEILLNKPALWNTESANLYKAVSFLYDTINLNDSLENTFGIRTISLTPEKGFLLNGEKIIALGGDIHHDLGCLGAAALERGYERRLQLLKEMGCNSIRLSHNPHSPILLDLCDKMGILVFDEAFDKWTSQYYGWEIPFMQQCFQDIEKFIKRDRNHPCVYIWSVGNEVEHQFGEFDVKFETQVDNADFGVTRLKTLISEVKKYDNTRKVTAALFPTRNEGKYVEWEHLDDYADFMKSSPPPMAFNMDVVSCNYTQNFFNSDHEKFPQLMFIASETAMVGFNPFERKLPWNDIDSTYVIGYYFWSAWDYLGESEWPTKTWGRSFYDLADEKTAIGYMHESFYSKKPMVHSMVFEQDTAILKTWDRTYPNKIWSWEPMSDHWNWSQYQNLNIQTFTNCEEVELFVNEKSYGKKFLKNYKDSVIIWRNIPYDEGKLKTIGRNNGKEVAQHEMLTAGLPFKIILEPDRSIIIANGLDLSYVKVKLVDKHGVIVPDNDCTIEFKVEGSGSNAGIVNGNTYTNEGYQGNVHSTYQGKCLLVIRGGREPGKIKITAKTKGLGLARCTIKATNL